MFFRTDGSRENSVGICREFFRRGAEGMALQQRSIQTANPGRNLRCRFAHFGQGAVKNDHRPKTAELISKTVVVMIMLWRKSKTTMLRPIILSFFCLVLSTHAVDPTVTAQPVSISLPAAAPATAQPKISYSSADVDEPFVAMTFDDGPSPLTTPRLLDILAERHIKATFFIVGENAAQYPKIVKRIIAEGHEIGNHSWSHPNLALLSDDKVRSELQRTDDAIFQAAGVHPKLMRPPYGSLSSLRGQARWINREFGYKIILWDVDPLDWKYRNSTHVESEILNGDKSQRGAHPGAIILSHDIRATTVDAMPSTLDQLIAKGFKFVSVSELIAMQKPKPAASAPNPEMKSATPAPKTASAAAPVSTPPAR